MESGGKLKEEDRDTAQIEPLPLVPSSVLMI